MWCLYLDHTNGNINRDLFEAILVKFCQNQLIEPLDIPPARIKKLTQAVESENSISILAFVHTERHEAEWVQFADNHCMVRLVLLSRNADQFENQGQYGCHKNVQRFAPANEDNCNLVRYLKAVEGVL